MISALLLGRLKAWRRDRRGVAAVEFALTVPIMLTLYLGGFEASQAVATYRKLADTTSTLANVTAQYTTMASTDVSTVFNASAQIMSPFPTSSLGVVLTEITTDNNSNATVTWSCGYNGSTPLTTGANATVPAGMLAASTSYILVTTSYVFALPTGYAFSNALTMTNQIYMIPRNSSSIPLTTACP